MVSAVQLKHGYFYGLFPLFILGLLLIISLIVYLRNKKKTKAASETGNSSQKTVIKHVTFTTKEKYINVLTSLGSLYEKGEITEKEAYKKLSFYIREFIDVSTGFTLSKKTLGEIKLMNLPSVEELISECYVPEFSEDTHGNLSKSIEKTIGIIEKWS